MNTLTYSSSTECTRQDGSTFFIHKLVLSGGKNPIGMRVEGRTYNYAHNDSASSELKALKLDDMSHEKLEELFIVKSRVFMNEDDEERTSWWLFDKK